MTIKKFYVIRFKDGTYFKGSCRYTRDKVDFSNARVYTKKNHASLSASELKMKDFEIVELEVAEPEYANLR